MLVEEFRFAAGEYAAPSDVVCVVRHTSVRTHAPNTAARTIAVTPAFERDFVLAGGSFNGCELDSEAKMAPQAAQALASRLHSAEHFGQSIMRSYVRVLPRRMRGVAS
jgi:hypothetical protein